MRSTTAKKIGQLVKTIANSATKPTIVTGQVTAKANTTKTIFPKASSYLDSTIHNELPEKSPKKLSDAIMPAIWTQNKEKRVSNASFNDVFLVGKDNTKLLAKQENLLDQGTVFLSSFFTAMGFGQPISLITAGDYLSHKRGTARRDKGHRLESRLAHYIVRDDLCNEDPFFEVRKKFGPRLLDPREDQGFSFHDLVEKADRESGIKAIKAELLSLVFCVDDLRNKNHGFKVKTAKNGKVSLTPVIFDFLSNHVWLSNTHISQRNRSKRSIENGQDKSHCFLRELEKISKQSPEEALRNWEDSKKQQIIFPESKTGILEPCKMGSGLGVATRIAQQNGESIYDYFLKAIEEIFSPQGNNKVPVVEAFRSGIADSLLAANTIETKIEEARRHNLQHHGNPKSVADFSLVNLNMVYDTFFDNMSRILQDLERLGLGDRVLSIRPLMEKAQKEIESDIKKVETTHTIRSDDVTMRIISIDPETKKLTQARPENTKEIEIRANIIEANSPHRGPEVFHPAAETDPWFLGL